MVHRGARPAKKWSETQRGCAEELHVRVSALEKEGHEESPGLHGALQLEQLALIGGGAGRPVTEGVRIWGRMTVR